MNLLEFFTTAFSIKTQLRGKAKAYRIMYYFEMGVWSLLLILAIIVKLYVCKTIPVILCCGIPIIEILTLLADSEKIVSFLGCVGSAMVLLLFTIKVFH